MVVSHKIYGGYICSWIVLQSNLQLGAPKSLHVVMVWSFWAGPIL